MFLCNFLLRSLCSPRLPFVLLRAAHSGNAALPMPPALETLSTPEENAQARTWLEQFEKQEIPKNLVEVTFSRSSGPGGQNVNKVNTKAMLRCALSSKWIPLWARADIKKDPFYVSSTQCIQITSTVSRSQAQNVEDCLSKLHTLIVSASSASLVNEPSEAQKARVRALERAEKARRRADKDRRSAVKKGRAKGAWD